MSRRAERGSIVIEAMVAALIVAALAAALFQVVASRAISARRLADQRDAVLVAQSRLAALDLRASEVPGMRSGREGRFVWQWRAVPFHAEEASAAGTLALVAITVRSSAAPGPLVMLRSLRLVR
jgi:type II secretory pathway component PulJ